VCPPQYALEPLTEGCDGADFGTASCASLGFTGGTLGCTSCSFDTQGCDSCVADAHSLACRHTELSANSPSSLALTASDDEIAVAWVARPQLPGNNPALGSARLARFAPDLSLIFQSDGFGPAHAHRVALARSRSGYIAAIDDDAETSVSIQALDASGSALGPARILPDANVPTLVERVLDGVVLGGPLLVWFGSATGASGAPLRAELLGDDGAAETPPSSLLADVPAGVQSNGVFTGAGFLVAPAAGWVLSVALDGTVTRPPLFSATGEYPGLAWSAAGGAVVWLDANWQRFDASGAAIGAAVTLPKAIFIPSAIVMQGSDSIVAFGTDTHIVDMDGEISVGRFGADGATVTAPFRVVVDPEGLAQPRLARRGPETVLAWVGGVSRHPGHIGLARLAP
jgi:hypothetical protein